MLRQVQVPTGFVRGDGRREEFRTDDVVVKHYRERTIISFVNRPPLEHGDSMVYESRVFELSDDLPDEPKG